MKRRDRIHSVIVSYNRLELTKQAISSYLETVTLPYSLIVVDNGSDAETQDWLVMECRDFSIILLGENRYPGFATNRGWEHVEDATLLHRADNDFSFLPGWCDQVLAVLENKAVGQVGLRTHEEELWNPHNVGGNCVIRRKLWDQGLRYHEEPWGDPVYPVGWTEDSLLSPKVVAMGYRWARVKEPCIVSLSGEGPDDPYRAYYEEGWRVRGITPPE